ncbi:MAG: hypothetical protein ACPGWR_14805 [Ardenticatenaceae bacterium]
MRVLPNEQASSLFYQMNKQGCVFYQKTNKQGSFSPKGFILLARRASFV